MAFVCVDKDGSEWIFKEKPVASNYEDEWIPQINAMDDSYVALPSGSIRKLIGRELTWEDEPCELKEE